MLETCAEFGAVAGFDDHGVRAFVDALKANARACVGGNNQHDKSGRRYGIADVAEDAQSRHLGGVQLGDDGIIPSFAQGLHGLVARTRFLNREAVIEALPDDKGALFVTGFDDEDAVALHGEIVHGDVFG